MNLLKVPNFTEGGEDDKSFILPIMETKPFIVNGKHEAHDSGHWGPTGGHSHQRVTKQAEVVSLKVARDYSS